MGNCLLNSLSLSINSKGGNSPLRFVERQDEGRARGCAPVPGQGIGAALRCLLTMATDGQASYEEPWECETSLNTLINAMPSFSRGRLNSLAQRLATIRMYFATFAASGGASPSVQEIHAGVWKDACAYVMTSDGKKVLGGPALDEVLGKLKQAVDALQTEAQDAGARFDQAPSGPVVAPSSIGKHDPLKQIEYALAGNRGGGGGWVDEIKEPQELPGASRAAKIPRKLPTFATGAC